MAQMRFKPIDFWAAFKESGAADRCVGEITELQGRLRAASERAHRNSSAEERKAAAETAEVDERQVEGIFLRHFENSSTLELMKRAALEQLTAQNWRQIDEPKPAEIKPA